MILFLSRLGTALLGEDGVIGITLAQGLDDLLLGLQIGVANEVIALFSGDIEPFEVIEMAKQDAAGAESGTLSYR
ncbi:hypothetical protein BN873_10051 [Candidatus Competibacter denitrificans Run_A_D11]|uniref:Uncharacterized protein n=1 Tax=Candidatus Competibacter denitrificans Run_A_D11 TaxID=1400863 RepID=W6M4P5_9GAMM|nr:hypothetical protein BN873_10051 [Candidatus Competibacter denitrificans Run_A_D11]